MQNTELHKTILTNINRLMHAHNVSMRQLSSDIGCSDSYIQKVMAQEIDPSLDSLSNISQRFHVPIQSLFEMDALRSAKLCEIGTYLVAFDDTDLDAMLQLSKSVANHKSK